MIDQQPNINSDDEGETISSREPFERDDEGEKLLMSLLGGQWEQMDIDMEDSSSVSNKKRKVEEEEEEDESTPQEEEVFGELEREREGRFW